MAGRQFNRLRKQLGADLPPAPPSEESSSEEEDEVVQKAPFNPFELLTDDEGPEAPAEEDEDEGGSAQVAAAPARPAALAAGAGKKNRKQQKKKRGKPGQATGRADSEAEQDGAAQQQEAKAGEDIDQILQELDIQVRQDSPGSAAGIAAAAGQQAERPLLGVDVRHLRADEELRKMFGARVVEGDEEERGDAAFAGASRRVRRLAARGLIRRAALKKGAIISPRDTWPAFEGGPSLEYRGVTADGKLEFSYSYSQAYQAVQELYEQCQASFDPNNIAALLQHHPYHLDALLTMTDLYRSMGENSYADEMLERCVYALEMSWHPSFNLAAASMFVPFGDANKPLFLALFKYQQALSRRGLHKTALEVCKLLLALNPGDPMGALFAIDYLAVRAGRYAFLQRFAREYGGDQSANLFPNIVYSLALAKWYQEQEQQEVPSSSRRGSSSGSGTPASASQHQQQQQQQGGEGSAAGEAQSSSDLLTKAVLMYPLVVTQLLKKLQEKGTGNDSDWAYLLSQPVLRDADDGGSASLGHLVDIFVERQHLLWKAQPVQEWLKAACRRAVEGRDLPDGITAADWACVREQAFPPSDDNQYRHLRLYEFSDTVQRIPAEHLHGMHPGGGAGAAAAGIRPEDLAALEAEFRDLQARAQAEGRAPEELLQDGNPLLMLLRTLLPWVNPGQQPDYEQEDQEGQQPGGGQ
ncbi:hypothetical protein N2152v2_002909 [Parachlorella kessleri]